MKKAGKLGMGIMGIGLGAGAGASALGAMGGTVAGHAATGLGNLSGALPAVGTIGGMGMVMGQMKGMQHMMKKRK